MASRVAAPPATEQPQYRLRFAVAYAVLAVLAAGALWAAYALADERGATPSSAAWSAWAPEGGDIGAYPQQIAEYVAGRYTAPDGGTMTRVLAGPPVIQDVPLRAIDPGPGGGATPVPVELTVMYTLCGSGENCTVAGGAPSDERHLLVRRQVLELALYTFRYIEPVEAVLALLPPAGDEEKSGAMLIRREDVARELGRPLAETLAAAAPRAGTYAAAPEGRAVDELTRRMTFDWEVQQLQDGSIAMLLSQLERGTEPKL